MEMKPEFGQEFLWAYREIRHVIYEADEIELRVHRIISTKAEEANDSDELVEELAGISGEAMTVSKRFARVAECLDRCMKMAEENATRGANF